MGLSYMHRYVFRRACAQMVIDFNEHVHSCNGPERATELPVLAF